MKILAPATGATLATLSILSFPVVAIAQEESQPRQASASLADIIVTAQKRGQAINKVPISILATTGEDIAERQITAPEELSRIAPDLRVQAPQGRAGQTFTIRGVGPANQYNFNVQQPVGSYMDELYQVYTPTPGIQLFDIDRVEILKGPQGTLFGRNTTGGAINIITRNPDLAARNENPNYIRGSYGNFNAYTLEGGIEAILVPGQLGIRVAGFRSETDGYMRNLGVGDRHLGAAKETQGRITIAFDNGENFDGAFKVYLNDYNGTQAGPLAFGVLPGQTNVAGYSRAGLTNRQVETTYTLPQSSSSQQAGLTLNWSFGDIKITSISQVQGSKNHNSADCDGSPVDICRSSYHMSGWQVSQDLRLAYENDWLTLIAGGFYGQDVFRQRLDALFGGTTALQNFFRQKRETYGAYADATFKVTPALSLSVGLRDTQDKASLSKVRTYVLDGFFGNPIGMTIPFAGAFVPGAYLNVPSQSDNGLSGRAIVTFQPTTRQMYYASYSHGYRSGVFNGTQFFDPAEVNYVGPEKVDNFEAGAKIGFMDGRAQFNIAAFYTDIKGQQVLTSFNVPPCPTCTPPRPAVTFSGLGGLDGRLMGLEAEFNLQVTPRLNVHLVGSLLDSKYDANQQVAGTPVGGNRFAFVSKSSGLAGVEWGVWQSQDERNKIVLEGNASYVGQFYFDPQNGKDAIVPGTRAARGQSGYVLVDGNIRYVTPNYTFSVWGKNIFNKFYLTALINTELGFGTDYSFRGAPRTYGVSASLKF